MDKQRQGLCPDPRLRSNTPCQENRWFFYFDESLFHVISEVGSRSERRPKATGELCCWWGIMQSWTCDSSEPRKGGQLYSPHWLSITALHPRHQVPWVALGTPPNSSAGVPNPQQVRM